MKALNKTLIALATGAILTTSAAHATGGQPYIGVKVGQSHIDVDDTDINVDKSTTYGVYAGYSFDNHFGAELEYISSQDADFTDDFDDSEGELNMNNIGLYGTYHHHLPNELSNLYVKGKLGFAKIDIENNEGYSIDDSGVAGGVAVGYNLGTNTSVELEYSKLPSIDETDDTLEINTDMWTIGAHYRF